jgi:hypothetical protein
MGIHEDQIKLEPLGDDVDENNNDEPLENGFGKKITLYNCGIKMYIILVFIYLNMLSMPGVVYCISFSGYSVLNL